MKIPKKIKILGHIYKIILERECKNLTNLADHDCGNNSQVTGEIIINQTLMQSEKEVTLIHEILHIIMGGNDEEKLEMLAQSIYQVLSDNKLLN